MEIGCQLRNINWGRERVTAQRGTQGWLREELLELEDDLGRSSLLQESLDWSWPEWVALHPGWLHLCL